MIEKVKKEINITTIILLGTFLLYVVLGMFLSYYNEVDNSMYFGSDNSRAYVDLVDVKDPNLGHHRITVHPLMMILLQPLTSLLTGIFHDARMGLIVLQALMGAGCVAATYKMLKKICKNKVFIYLLPLIYALSFSNIVFSTVPETFIFAGFIMTCFWLYVLEAGSSDECLTRSDYLILVFFGIFSFGITITNYISYFIGVLYLLYKKQRSLNKSFWFDLAGIHILNLDFIIVLSTLQQKIWVNSPTFIEGICDALFAKTQFEEYDYMNFAVGGNKLKEFLVQFFCLPILSADVAQVQVNEVYTPILFQRYSSVQKGFLALFFVAVAASIVLFFLQKKKTRITELIFVCGTLLFNFVLHYFYGYNEAFMYSPHFLFLLFLFWGLCLNIDLPKGIKVILGTVLALFALFEVGSNFSVFVKMTKLIQVFYGNYYYYEPLIAKSICLGIVVGFCILAGLLFARRVKEALQVNKRGCILAGIGIYAMLVLISCFSIRVNYWRI